MRGNHMQGCQFSRSPPVAGEGKVKVVHQYLVLPFGDNIEGGTENEGSQQDVDGPQDCILTVSEDCMPETEVMSTYPKPTDDGDAIHALWVQMKGKLIIGLKPYGNG